MRHDDAVPPFHELGRAAWSGLATGAAPELADDELVGLSATGEMLKSEEITEIYAPLAELVRLHLSAAQALHASTARYLGRSGEQVPFVLGIAGSVAAGKSTTARVLQALLSKWGDRNQVALVTTDGFLMPNAELIRRGILHKKGFPESYDQRALLRFITQVKAGNKEVTAPIYSHLHYDIVPDERVVVKRPDILILEGLNVLAPPHQRMDGRMGLAVSDFFDFAVYIDASLADIRRWYVSRFLTLRETAFANPVSYFHRYAALTDDEAVATAQQIWAEINEPNLVDNILPTRARATVVLNKTVDHSVRRVRVRRL